MSRILRRPMFRGGRVDSRGTGITSGLGYNAGGRVGYNVGGVITLQDILKQTGAPMTGSQILQYAQDKNLNLGPNFKINPYSKFIPETVEVSTGEDVVEKPFSEILRTEGFQTYEDPKGYLGAEDTQGSIGDKTTDGGRTFSSDFGTTEQVAERVKTPTVITGEGVDLGDDDDTTVGQTDLQDMIDRYEALLGGDKAKQRDVGDILGRASAAFLGAGDVREGLKEFMKAESQAGPSRTERIKQAAAMLGIKGEQAKELYETKLKNEKGMFTKKVEEIMRANDVDRRQATKMALGEPGTIGEAFVRYREKVGFPPSGVDFDALAEGYTSGPLPEDYATSKPTGTFYIPGEMVIVEMENGVQKSVRSYK